jgi:trans-2-enoyl-CoA reductase
MRAIHIQKYGRLPILTKCPIPSRNNSELLIKMEYAPINPSDLFFYLGLYGIKKEGFSIMGF